MDNKNVKEKLTAGKDKVNEKIKGLAFRNMLEKKVPAETRVKFPVLDKLIPLTNYIACGLALVLLVAVVGNIAGSSDRRKAAGAVELWNGFTTEMNKDQVIARAKTVFETDNFGERRNVNFVVFNDSGNRASLNSQFPTMELELNVLSRLPQYFYVYGVQSNASFYFNKGNLLAVKILFSDYPELFLYKSQGRYGASSRTLMETQPTNIRGRDITWTWYIWEFPERTIYIPGQAIGAAVDWSTYVVVGTRP